MHGVHVHISAAWNQTTIGVSCNQSSGRGYDGYRPSGRGSRTGNKNQ